MTPLLINGRFLSRPATGVDRTATELVRALKGRRKDTPSLVLSVAVPADAPEDEEIRERLDLDETSAILRSRLRGYGWEQLELAILCPEQLLLSFCNMGPVLRRKQLILMHDAQVHDVPESYSPAFRRAYHLIQPLLARRAKFIATVSRHSAERLQHHGIGHGRAFEILHNGIDHVDKIIPDEAILERLSLSRDGYYLAIGAKAQHKNIAMLQEAHAALPAPRLPLVLVGSGEQGVATDQIWAGRVTDAQLKALYAHARLFLMPSLTEGFGLPPLEAMACGCPVLASNAGALRETCGDAAAYCSPTDRSGWTTLIGELQASPLRLKAMRSAGLEQASRFRWEATADQLLQLLA